MGMVTPDTLIGQMLSHCQVEQLVYRGQVSAVYRAQQLRPNRPVAITVFLLPDTLSPFAYQRFRTRFLQQMPSLTTLRHEHLLPLYGYGEWQNMLYVITPYRSEGSLKSQLEQGPCSLAQTVTILEQVTAGLEYAHRHGKLHGALSPTHIVVSGDNTLQVAGLGFLQLLARRDILPIAEPAQHVLTLAGVPLVSPKYIAPEYRQGHELTIRSDVYTLGVTLLELLTGSPLSPTVNPLDALQQHATVPQPLKAVLQQTLATTPRQRLHRVSDLLGAWLAAIEQVPDPVAESKSARSPQSLAPQATTTDQASTRRQLAHESLVEESPVTGPRSSLPSGLPLSLAPNVRRSQQQHSSPRRRVTAVLVTGLALGTLGIGSFSLTRLLTAKPTTTVATMATHPIPQGLVAGNTQLALNSALEFKDPRAQSLIHRLLIHLPDGSFVAYQQSCTHSQVLVNYDPQTHLLVCPAHGAIFDPAQNGKVLRGPATLPLPNVAIRVNGDGSIVVP